MFVCSKTEEAASVQMQGKWDLHMCLAFRPSSRAAKMHDKRLSLVGPRKQGSCKKMQNRLLDNWARTI